MTRPDPRIRGYVFDFSHLSDPMLERAIIDGIDQLKTRDPAALKRLMGGEALDLQIETLCQTAAGADIALAIVEKGTAS